jgi:hypothetical protein
MKGDFRHGLGGHHERPVADEPSAPCYPHLDIHGVRHPQLLLLVTVATPSRQSARRNELTRHRPYATAPDGTARGPDQQDREYQPWSG